MTNFNDIQSVGKTCSEIKPSVKSNDVEPERGENKLTFQKSWDTFQYLVGPSFVGEVQKLEVSVTQQNVGSTIASEHIFCSSVLVWRGPTRIHEEENFLNLLCFAETA
ncbi:hypothetical protein AVEN_272864-1 [Araneus ventricosus]|uniref:Uncharacterized protein n=1 Tax=Araneus ventricosus TaxID=182803 RepID=A0A4Y2S158_ARAVE|nr:hypothetical protein AVEN_272864-1 [Araneus ventricosus]